MVVCHVGRVRKYKNTAHVQGIRCKPLGERHIPWTNAVFSIITQHDLVALLTRDRPGHSDRHFIYTAGCIKTTLAPPTETLRFHETKSAY